MTYTVKLRERGKMLPFLYIGSDGKTHAAATLCKPLSRDDAELAKQLLIEGAAKAGRLIECQIVELGETV